MRDAVRSFLTAAGDPDVEFGMDDVRRWRPGTFPALRRAGWLRRATSARTVACDACGDDHVEDVQYVVAPVGARARAYIACPENLRVEVPRTRLRQWSVDRRAIVDDVARAIDAPSEAFEQVAAGAWRIPNAEVGDGLRGDVVLEFGSVVETSGGETAALRLQAAGDAPGPIAVLGDFVRIDGSRLSIDAETLRTAISPTRSDASDPGPEPDATFSVRTDSGLDRWSRAEYEAAVSAPGEYDLFIDAVGRRAWRRCDDHTAEQVTLTDSQLDLLVDLVEAGQPVAPYKTPHGSHSISAQAARKMFDRARAKLDVKGEDGEYTYFHVIRSAADRYLTPCQFLPPSTARYCVVFQP